MSDTAGYFSFSGSPPGLTWPAGVGVTLTGFCQPLDFPSEPESLLIFSTTVADVAVLLDLKPYTVKEYARRGILPGRKLGRTRRFLRPELEEAILGLPNVHA
jgi:Helix-turn-helix domain